MTARKVQEPEEIRELLAKQVSSSVLWQQSVEYMLEQGVTTFVEIGPGKTLSGFVRKINKEAKVFHIEKCSDLEQLSKCLGKWK